MEKINIGIIGCASIAKQFIIPNINDLNEQYNLVGISSRRMEKADEFASEFQTKAYHGYQNLIDEKDIDAVYIPLPNSLHAEWIEKSIENDIHVLVEKPQACTKEDVIRLNKAAQKKQLALIENFQFRFHSQLRKIIDILESGSIGEIRCIKSSFGFPPFPDDNNIRYQKELGGGALLDAGAYVLKISQLLMGYDVEVKASSMVYDQTKQVDVWGGGFLQQKNGSIFSEVAYGFDNYYQCCLEIWGSKGKLIADRIFTAPPGFESRIILETASDNKEIKVKDNHFQNMLIHFHKAINKKNILNQEYEQNIKQANLIDEFREKATSR